jgi:4-nitrophenyl phosphatase
MIYAVDIDGTLFFEGIGLAEGAVEFIQHLYTKGHVYLLSNNSTQSRIQMQEKVYPVVMDEDHIVSTLAMVEYTIRKEEIASAYYIGNFVLEQYIINSGAKIDRNNAEAVFIGYTQNPKFSSITIASRLVKSGAKFYSLGNDSFYPVFGKLTPGVGYLEGAIAQITGKQPMMLGKPGVSMLNMISEKENSKDIIMVGDNPDTDIRMANSFGCKSLLIGKRDPRATYCAKDLKEAMKKI